MLPAKSVENKLSSLSSETQPCRCFSLAEVQRATRNFAENLVIGRGESGKVYKGYISYTEDGRTDVAAIKRLESGFKKSVPEFWAEFDRLFKLRHSHLASLIGYCIDRDEMILVYEYTSHGTLEDHLHKVGTQLSWMQRLKICAGAACGLDYLHTGTIMHHNIKSSNILLDDIWVAKISVFGLSKVGLGSQTSTDVSADIKGSLGYTDPEYLLTGNLSRKSDVYAFGVILFEVLSGRCAVDTSLDEEQWGLARWAQDCVRKGKLDQIVDFNLKGQVFPKCLKKFLKIAGRCLHNHSKERPTMAEVVVSLEFVMALQERLSNSIQPACIMALSRKVKMLFSGPSTALNSAHSKTSRSNRINIDDGGSSEENKGNNIDNSGSSKENRGSSKEKSGISIDDSGSAKAKSGDVPLDRHVSTPDLKKFSFDSLDRATQNFKKDNLLGQGDFGQVYKGWIHEKTYSPSKLKLGMVVAVKRLYPGKFNSYRLVWEWLAKYNHTNLVELLGYCLEGEKFLLVYEFMENGSLSAHLFKSAEPLPWFTRVRILEGAARGLAFLHATIKESSNKQFETHNILLDREFNSKLSYVGLELANTFPGFTALCPSAPPETLRGEYDMKSDVFVFGGVLLEVLTGFKKYTPQWEMSKENLSILPISHNSRELDKQYIWSLVDPRLVGNYPRKAAVLLLLLARSCLKDNPKDRPSMEEVLTEVEGISGIKIDVTLDKVNLYRSSNRRPQASKRVSHRSSDRPQASKNGMSSSL